MAIQLEQKNKGTHTPSDLRTIASNYMANNKDDFLPFLEVPESEYQSFCENVKSNKSYWGGQLEIKALCQTLQLPIHIYSDDVNSPIIMGEEFDCEPLLLSYHRLLYTLGNHYNAIVPE